MVDKRSHLFQMDDTLRLIFAFYSCISDNPNWIMESETAKHNREVAKKILTIDDNADYYFMMDYCFYSFTVGRLDEEMIDCTIEEYDSFYDLSSKRLSLNFSYHIPTKSIIRLGKVREIKTSANHQKRKIA